MSAHNGLTQQYILVLWLRLKNYRKYLNLFHRPELSYRETKINLVFQYLSVEYL